MIDLIAILALGIWIYLWRARAGFWRIEDDVAPPSPAAWPPIAVVIPARNEASLIGETLASLWQQAYPGLLQVVVVDDGSEDETAARARGTAEHSGRAGVFQIIPAGPRPPGWTGKVWAMQQGLSHVRAAFPTVRYVLFSDADIHHGPEALKDLVSRAEAGRCDLVSFMVRLRCQSLAEKLMIPAFVFFFRMLYPFTMANERVSRCAAAAGGTILVRCEALERVGGFRQIRGALIDDCALAGLIKGNGRRIWIGLSRSCYSTRSYGALREIIAMVARSAYTQLGCSPIRLVACLLGLCAGFLGPPLTLLLSSGGAAAAGEAAWLLMAALYLPMVRFYGLPRFWALTLPAAAALYLWATILSAWKHHTGRGGEWKGRFQVPASR